MIRLGTFFTGFLFLLGFFLSGSALAQSSAKVQGILLNADSMFRDTENDTIELQGNVQIVLQEQHIKCDKAKINFRTRQADLTGSVEIVSPKNIIGGTAVSLDYENNTGIIYNGFVQSGTVVFSGALLHKASDNEYLVSNADFTTCTNCPATWGFSGSNIRAELGGYAYIKNSFLKIYSVPILWLPYLIVPLKSDRQSGLLTPRILADQAGGLGISESFFWAISRSTDATIGLTNYEKRGLKSFGEYRYVLNGNSAGNLNAAVLTDRVFQNDGRVTTFESPEEKGRPITRWYTKYEHFYIMPNDYVQRAQLNLASDLQYAKDFPEETDNFGDPAMDNRISLTKSDVTNYLSVDTSYYINFLQSDPIASNNNAVHRMPEIRYSRANEKIGNSRFFYSYNLNYVNFARSEQAFDNMENANGVRFISNTCHDPRLINQDPNCRLTQDGVFDPNVDLLRTGQRFDGTATISRPVNFGDYLDVLPTLSYRETDYEFNAGTERSNYRRYVRATVGAKTSFGRVFETGKPGPKATKYKHEIVPEVIATTIPWLEHPSHPFFGTATDPDGTFYTTDYLSDADVIGPHGVQFDYNDRIYERGLVTFALNNKVVQKKWVGGNPTYLQIASLKILQSYDTYQANLRNPTREPWSDLTAILDLRFPYFQTYSVVTYLHDIRMANVNSRINLNNDYGQFFQLQWVKTYQRAAVDLEKSRVEDYTFAAGFTSSPLNFMGKFVYNANWENTTTKEKITSWAYVAQLKPPGECWVINVTQYLPTDSGIKTHVDFVFNYDGVTKPPLPAETLSKYGF